MLEMMMEHHQLKADETISLGIDMSFDEAGNVFDVTSTPTLIMLDDEDKEVARVTGTNQQQVKDLFEKRG